MNGVTLSRKEKDSQNSQENLLEAEIREIGAYMGLETERSLLSVLSLVAVPANRTSP